MSLARALTKRMKRNNDDNPSTPVRGNTIRYAPGTINRNNISLPTELISTTNVQALTAPDINKMSGSSSSSSSTHSGHDSDFSTIDRSFLNDSSPPTPITPPSESEKGFFDTPIVPQRAPSHSKQAHVELSRKLSIQRMSPPPSSLTRARSFRKNEVAVEKEDEDHPFGRELAQVNEVAEDFGGSKALLDEEEEFMQSKGLIKFGVEDYINEIQQLYGGVFEDQLGPAANPWM